MTSMDWILGAGQVFSALVFAYGGYLSVRYFSLPSVPHAEAASHAVLRHALLFP